MPLKIICEDITKINCDAIVNAANSTLLGGGGVDGAIHKAAGKNLLAECRTLGGCKTGEAKITKGYKLPAKYIIHTVGPRYKDGKHEEESYLRACYRNSLELAKQNKCKSVAFPLISSGIYMYPKDEALKVAVDEISTFLFKEEMLVYIVIYDKSNYKIDEKLFNDISAYIDKNYVESILLEKCLNFNYDIDFEEDEQIVSAVESEYKKRSLDDALKQLDESFSQMLLRKIDEKGMTDAECYKNANIDRKLFSKIRSNRFYKPSKTTAIAFAIALELSLAETNEMLMKAGFALSHSNKFDIVIEYFIINENYNIFEINQALFALDLPLLGV